MVNLADFVNQLLCRKKHGLKHSFCKTTWPWSLGVLLNGSHLYPALKINDV